MPAWHRKPAIFQMKFKFWTEATWSFHYSSDEQIIETITEIKFAIIVNLVIHSWEERLTCFDCKRHLYIMDVSLVTKKSVLTIIHNKQKTKDTIRYRFGSHSFHPECTYFQYNYYQNKQQQIKPE